MCSDTSEAPCIIGDEGVSCKALLVKTALIATVFFPGYLYVYYSTPAMRCSRLCVVCGSLPVHLMCANKWDAKGSTSFGRQTYVCRHYTSGGVVLNGINMLQGWDTDETKIGYNSNPLHHWPGIYTRLFSVP